MNLLILTIYGLALLFIFGFCMSQLQLWFHYKRYVKNAPDPEYRRLPDPLPDVTVQLPVYNEYYVISRLMDAVAQFEYPSSKLEIQVLDDSTDETVDLIAGKTRELRENGIQVVHIKRESRKGYKAGALQYGLEKAKGDFIAIFDADFVPKPDFLQQTIPYFQNPNIGLVQTKWEHLNKDYSIFTRAQALALDNHFEVEQTGRNASNSFINFNGTAGIWRKATIQDAGGWQYDTLTEDLDLSYRAQLRNWQFQFLKGHGAPAELPAELNSIKSQQYRWNKGGAETAIKLFPKVFQSGLPFKRKVHAFFHLFNSTVFVCILICALLSVPALIIKNQGHYPLLFKGASLFLLSLLAICWIYFDSFKQQYSSFRTALWEYLKLFPLFLCISMGMSLHNGIAVIKGWVGVKSPFIRTPKFNLKDLSDHWSGKKYLKGKINGMPILEGLLALYFIGGIGLGFFYGDAGLVPFHIMLTIGFGSISIYTFCHTFSIQSKNR